MVAQRHALEQMKSYIGRWEQAHDRRAIFLTCYAQMTSNMLDALDADEFGDFDWVAKLLDHFADYYFCALSTYESERAKTPAVWRYTFDAANRPETTVVQNLFFGVNAHINYDLVLAVADLLEPEWKGLLADARKSRYQDFCHVNRIIARTIDSVQDNIVERYVPAMDLLDQAMGPLDEWLIARLITRWRDAAWDYAVQRVETPGDDEREVLRRKVEAATLRWAHLIGGRI